MPPVCREYAASMPHRHAVHLDWIGFTCEPRESHCDITEIQVLPGDAGSIQLFNGRPIYWLVTSGSSVLLPVLSPITEFN